MTGRLAAWLDSYRAGLRDALDLAARQGFHRVQANTAAGELRPGELTASARRHLRRYLRERGLTLDALALEFAGPGLADPARADERLEQLRETLTLCRDLEVTQAAVRIGGLADQRQAPLGRAVLAAAAELADRYQVDTAVLLPADEWEPGAAALRAVGSPQLVLALDTAQWAGRPGPLPATRVGSVYLRDVRRAGSGFEEVSFGTGEVDFAAVLGALAERGSAASLVVRRDGPGGVDALRAGREYIASLSARREGR